MKRPRKHISLKTKLAATIVAHLKHVDEHGNLVPLVSYEDAKKLTEDQILSLVHFDHNIQHAIDGEDAHWNLTPRPILEHREKTAKKDRPAIAKADRVEEKHAAFRAKILRKAGQSAVDPAPETSHKPTRKQGWPQGRKLQSKPFPKRTKQDV